MSFFGYICIFNLLAYWPQQKSLKKLSLSLSTVSHIILGLNKKASFYWHLMNTICLIYMTCIIIEFHLMYWKAPSVNWLKKSKNKQTKQYCQSVGMWKSEAAHLWKESFNNLVQSLSLCPKKPSYFKITYSHAYSVVKFTGRDYNLL